MGTPMSPSLLSGRGSRTVSRLVSLPRLQITEAHRDWGLHKSVRSRFSSNIHIGPVPFLLPYIQVVTLWFLCCWIYSFPHAFNKCFLSWL